MIYLTDYDIYLNTFFCLIDMIVIMELRERIYGRVAHLRGICIALSAALAVLMMILPESYRNTYFTLPVSMVLLPFYPKNLKKKLLFEVCLFSSVFTYMMALNDITNMAPRFSQWGITYIAIFHAGLWVLLFVVLRLCRNIDTDIPLSLWFIFLLIPVCIFASSAALIPLLGSSHLSRPESDLLHLVVQTTFLFINLALLEFLRKFTGYFQKEKEQSLLRQQLQYQENHYQHLIRSSEQIQKIRHDMKNHLQTLSVLYNENKTDELQEYLRQTYELLGHSEQVISTGNPSFDAVLNIKLAEMGKIGISCSPALSIPRGLDFPFSDTVTILGNLLDNAINSCTATSSVSLSVTWQQGTLFLHMENPCASEKKLPYGIGMKNVEETVKKYSGTLHTEVKDGKYITDIILYRIEIQHTEEVPVML